MNPVARKLLWVAGLLGGGVVLLVLFCFDPARTPIYPVCAFRQLTGLDCPGCGSLRAMHQLLHGHIGAALRFNALAVLSVPLFAWVVGRFAWQEFKGGPGVTVRPLWCWLYLAAWLAFGVLRDLPLPLFASLAP